MKTSKTYILCALFSLLAASQALGQDIVGAWTHGDTTKEGSGVIVFLANGRFVNIEHASWADEPAGYSGFERGNYTWDPATGALTIALLQDTNGDIGVGRLRTIRGVTLTLSGNTGTLNVPGFGADTLTRVTGASPIVGAWSIGDGGKPEYVVNSNPWAVFAFLPNGEYFSARDTGIGHGTYRWNPATSFLDQVTSSFDQVYAYLYERVDGPVLVMWDDWGYWDGELARVGAAASSPPPNYQGLFWNAPAGSESGWGINLAHQGDVIFATWFTYDAAGKTLWLSMAANKTAENMYAGTLLETRGPPFSATPFNPAAVSATAVGSGALTFSDADNGSFSYTVNGITQTKAITRQVFGQVPRCAFGARKNLAKPINYQDLWYAAPADFEAGWGVNFTHQGDTIYATWFTYDVDGTPLWLSATTAKTGPSAYTGTLYRSTGPAFNAMPFRPANVGMTSVGTLTLNFTSDNRAFFTYTVALNGPASSVTQTKLIMRQVFRAPGTVCQ